MTALASSHIQLDERGVAWIDDTNIKVIEIALEMLAHGSSAEEIRYQHYSQLSLAQIYAALTYYYDHQADLDEQIAKDREEYERRRSETADSPGRQRLRAIGKLP